MGENIWSGMDALLRARISRVLRPQSHLANVRSYESLRWAVTMLRVSVVFEGQEYSR